jgi:hypothetical protein
MERRSHRIAILAGVVVLHLVVLVVLRITPRVPPRAAPRAERPMIVEFLLQPSQADRSAALAMPQLRHPRQRTRARQAGTPTARTDTTQAVEPVADVVPAFRLIGDDGRLRVSRHLAQELDAAADAERARGEAARGSFHMPAGDAWVMKEPRSPIDPGLTRFSDAWKPSDMNPIEEACWHHKGLALVMSIVGSVDCAEPGRTRRPTPEMIVYGVDDGADILRKTADWKRYGRR